MDVLAATANWDVTLDRDRARIAPAVLALPLDMQGARYAEVLLAWQDGARLSALLAETRKISGRMPAAARDINKEWLARLKKVESALGTVAS